MRSGFVRRQLLVLIMLLLLASCSPTTSDGSSSSTTSDTSVATTQEVETTEASNSGVTSQVLEELESELRAWGVSDDSIQCVTDGLVEGGYVQGLDEVGLLEMVFVDESAPFSEFPPELARFVEGFIFYISDPQQGCLRPSELTTALENLTIEAEDFGYSSYGDDPTLDALYDGCVAGSAADCDMLFLVADFGSEYENMALTCGGLVEEIDSASTCMSVLQDFSEAEDLATQCESGFYIACDAYFMVTLVGSEEEALAASCGGIREPDATTPCWLIYGFGSR